MNRSDIGKKVAELRRQKGFSQDGLAYLCKMNVRSIQRIEAGNVQPRSYTLKLLSEALDFKFDYENSNAPKKFTLKSIFDEVKAKLAAVWKNEGEKNMEKESILKQITKSKQDKKITGICGGLGEHTSIPAWFWRVIFLASAFIYGFGVILYLLFWIFMPSEKLEIEKNNSLKNNWLNQVTKSATDKKVGGICGGLGDNTSVPSWCWRILFVASSFIYGFGIGIYILLWIFMPSAKPESEKNLSFA
jgi:phage shock protein PspC (stress-responsive transcriptional regulator)/DNA-binding XRE family transcriptional regulator